MPHVHGIAFLDRENVNEEFGKEFINEDNTLNSDHEDFHEFIDYWTSCSLDTSDEILDSIVKVNVHEHRDSCKRKVKINGEVEEVCRFDYPKMPSDRSFIAKPISSEDPEGKSKLERAKLIKNEVKKLLTEEFVNKVDKDFTIDDLLKKLDIKKDEYYEALKISEKGETVILKRKVNEVYVNSYNPTFLYAWRANMDIQICTDNYGVVTYVSEYFAKTDDGLTQKLREALKETKGWSDKDRMHYIKRIYMTYREVCVCEAIYRLLRTLTLKQSDLKAIFLQSDVPQKREAFLSKINENEEIMNTDEENENEYIHQNYVSPDQTVSVVGREGKFRRKLSIHDKYALRPKKLDNVCLAEFVTSFESCPKPLKEKFDENVSNTDSELKRFADGTKLPKYIKLTDSLYMKARGQRSVIRLHSYKSREGFAGIYAELLRFLPWRNEWEDLHPDDETKWENIFKKDTNKAIISHNRSKMLPFSSKLTEILESMEELAEEHQKNKINDVLDPAFEQENIDDEALMEELDTSELPLEADEKNLHPDLYRFKPIAKIDSHQMKLDVRSFSLEQRLVFEKVMEVCKGRVMSNSKFSVDVLPKRLIVHGGGGVGKSMLINVTARYGDKILTKDGDKSWRPKILLLGPTGMSACLIGKY